jgi:hypothetical protein
VRMREEMLAHLHAALEAEAPGEADDRVTHVLTRMGEPSILRNELQASIPYWERIAFRSIPFLDNFEGVHIERRSEVPPWRYALRITVVISLLVLPLALGIIVLSVFDRPPTTLSSSLVDLLCVAPVWLGTLFVMGWGIACLRLDRLLSPRSAAPALLRAAVLLGLIGLWIAVFVYLALSILSQDAIFAAQFLVSMANTQHLVKLAVMLVLTLTFVTIGFYWERLAYQRKQRLQEN